jgi:hypothetical protein
VDLQRRQAEETQEIQEAWFVAPDTAGYELVVHEPILPYADDSSVAPVTRSGGEESQKPHQTQSHAQLNVD